MIFFFFTVQSKLSPLFSLVLFCFNQKLNTMRDDDTAGNLLSTYLLQGWVMTDELCKVPGCSYPLMRSKDGSISFCTKHDELPNAPNANIKKPEQKQQQALPVVGDDELRIRRERREQSSKASQLIGQKMLQRWALLNEQCPNESCYAVPLIRNPDTKQMFCVICENYILTEEEEKAVMAKKMKKEPVVEEPPAITQSTEPASEPKLVHSPTITPLPKECKRQKVEKKSRKHKTEKTSHKPSSSIENASHFASDIVISRLSKKMELLTEQVEACDNPVQLTDLFKAIKSCAGAIQACIEASRS
ncbi:hypothetical protein K501DRAFT_324320 [Backusella circina FSU 941]|nr:hypothetical protein K501DRAFT_324320 [Backusella circina FSU 941]